MSPIHPSLILHILLRVNRFFQPRTIFGFLFFASFAFSNKANAVVVVIEGGSSFVCPKGTYTYTARTYHETLGYEITSCDITWNVYQGNQIVGGGTGANFTFTFPDVGVYEIQAGADGCYIYGDGVKTITTTSRVPIPSPISGPVMCPSGQSYTYTTSPTLESIFPVTGNCYYHYPYQRMLLLVGLSMEVEIRLLQMKWLV